MKTIKISVLIIAAAFIVIQFVPVNRDNPAGPDTFNAPDGVKKIIERSCYDCHSNRTRWPWYSYIAPVSWTIADDVRKARRRLNFSNWQNMPPKKQQAKSEQLSEEIQENEMPLPKYLKIHKDARLNGKEKQIIYKWAGYKGATRGENKEDDDD